MRGQLFTLPQGNYRIQAVKAQCEIRSLEKQLHLAHMRADLEAEESLRPTHSEVIHTLFCRKDAKLWRRWGNSGKRFQSWRSKYPPSQRGSRSLKLMWVQNAWALNLWAMFGLAHCFIVIDSACCTTCARKYINQDTESNKITYIMYLVN